MKPINIIKNTYREVAASEDLKDNLVNTSVGLVVGYLSKTLFESVSHSPVRKLIGTAILFGVTSAIRKNPDAIKSMAQGLFKMINSGVNTRADRSETRQNKQQVIVIKER